MVKTGTDRLVPLRAPMPPIAMGGAGPAARSRAEMVLRILLRVVALVWMVEGLHQWAGVLTAPGTAYLPAASPLHVSALFFFCILDFVAAVGLWLVARWGVAVWLTTVVGHGLALGFAPGFMADPLPLVLSDAVLVLGYAAAAWMVAVERRRA